MAHIFGIPHSLGEVWDNITSGPQGPTWPPPSFNTPGGAPPLPPAVITPGGANCGPGGRPYEIVTSVNSCGVVETKKRLKTRKRRKRLATASDIKDLSALKAILGGGKAFESWIATRSR